MHLSSEPSRRRFQQLATLIGILFLHVSTLWIFKLGGNQRPVEAIQYLTILNVPPIEKQIYTVKKSLSPTPNLHPKEKVKKIRPPDVIFHALKNELEIDVPSKPNTDINFKLNLNALRGQAVQIERTRVKSDIEKMNDSKKLNLTVEATFDREINKIILPDCHSALLGKFMPERMRIIQDHSKKKFCN